MSDFVHLHLHTEYSLVDGLLRIDDLVDRVAKQGGVALAITDQSNLFGMVKFYKAASQRGIKPIIGSEVWIRNTDPSKRPFRLVLLCQNLKGYRNLTELVSRSYLEGQSGGFPQISKQWLEEKQEGLIAISTSLESEISEALISDQVALAETLIGYWLGVFGNRFYLEVTRTGRMNEALYLERVSTLAYKKGCPLVASNDVRFLEEEEFEAHEARVCIHEGYTLSDPTRPKPYSQHQYLKSREEMQALFSDLGEALENSFEIAKRCNLELSLGKVHLPKFPVPKPLTIEQHLTEEANRGLIKRFAGKNIPEHYRERLETELKVLNSMGYAGYFLIVADFIRWAKAHRIPVGPGRGSGAGSLVAYSLDITGIDPLSYDLLFERFLNPERVDMPDFDIDFCMEGRDRVIDYVSKTYGRESVSQIITYGTMAAKAVIRDVGRVLGHPYGFVDKIAKSVPYELGITLDKALEDEFLKKRYEEEEEVKTLIDLAKKLEGITRNAGKHAGGVVIAPSKLTDFTPLYCDATEGVVVSQFDKYDVEGIGLVKFDFLGLRTLTTIHWAEETINRIREAKGEPLLDVQTIPLDDKKTFELLRSVNTTAVFQIESRGMKDLVRRLQPDIFEEIIALVALYRPGPLQSGMVEDFINRKQGRAQPEYLHPKLVSILKPTYGVILYQEQVMQIAQVLAGYSLGNADLLRRAMGKKKPEEMAKQRTIFTKGAIERGVDAATATYIFDLMEKFAGYGFNKSHSAAYALITYQTAWLKAHYPAAFMAAVLSSDMAHTDKVAVFMEECRNMGLKVLPPNVNISDCKFTVQKDNTHNTIVYGLGAIKGVGEAFIQNLIAARTKKPFVDLFDFCARMEGRNNRRAIEALIRSGAFDCFGEERSSLMASVDEALKTSEQMEKNRRIGQADLFGDTLSASDIKRKEVAVQVPPWSDELRLQGEKETLGFYLSGHPLERLEKDLKCITTSLIRDLTIEHQKHPIIAGMIVAIRSLQTKRGDKMAFITLEDRTGRQEVVVFSEQYQESKAFLIKDNIIVIEGELGFDNYSGGLKMRAVKIKSLDQALKASAKCLKIKIEEGRLNAGFIQELKAFLGPNAGDCPVYLELKKEVANVRLQLGEDWKINLEESLLTKLRELCGMENVEVL